MLGMAKLPCVEVSLPLARERELNVRLNKHTGDWDWKKLVAGFTRAELEGYGFDGLKIQAVLNAETLTETEEELRPLHRVHVLVSFAPELMGSLAVHLEALKTVPGVEYETSSN